MPLELGDGVCAACEPVARIWHKGNDPVGRHPIAITVVDVKLQEIATPSASLLDIWSKYFTRIIERVVASKKVVSAREKARSAHVEIPKLERFRMGERRKEQRLEARRPKEDPQLCHER